MNKGFVFTMDVLIGLSLVVMIILTLGILRFESVLPEKGFEKLGYITNDLIDTLSYLKVSEVQDQPTISNLIQEGALTERDLDKSVLDLIASFWYTNNKTIAENITREILQGLTDNLCINLTVETETIYSSCDSSAKDVAVASRIESGYQPGKPAFGYIARAFLTSIRGKRDSSYVYFGGYFGDGNVTRELNIPSFDTMLEAYMEVFVGADFDLFINGNYSGRYLSNSSGMVENMTADKWYLSPSNYTFFKEGNNLISINFTPYKSYVAGGFLKVTYNTTQMATEETLGTKNISLPGIYGVINLYDSFYVPGNLTSMEIYLHFSTAGNASLLMNIGNKTVYDKNESGLINNGTLSANLNYEYLSQKTVPIRLGHYQLNSTNKLGYVTDVFLTTSLVGKYAVGPQPPEDMAMNDIPNGTSNITRITAAVAVDKIFVNAILNNTGNNVGLVSYASTVSGADVVGLTDVNTTLITAINAYPGRLNPGNRWLCGAIMEAKNRLTDPLRKKYIVLMSDGTAQKLPGCLLTNLCPYANYSNISSYGAAAVNEAYDAYLRGITVYAIGFGETADNNLLKQIAACGGGKWKASTNYTGLEEIYKEFATEIAQLSIVYEFQKVLSTNLNSTLFPDSYIKLNYTPEIIPQEYGEISLTREGNRLKDFTGNDIDLPCKEGWYNISESVKVVDAKMTAYSAEFWTDRLSINSSATGGWKRTFWLGDFGNNYLILGDPYIVQIPVNLISSGNNSVCMGSGFNVTNETGGSPDNRFIYTMRVRGDVGYGAAFNNSEEAVNDAINRLINKVEGYVNVTTDDIDMGTKTIGGIQWLWGPSLLKIVAWEKG